MRAGDRVLMVLRPEMAREGVLRTPLRVLSSIFLLSTPVRTPPKLSVQADRQHVRKSLPDADMHMDMHGEGLGTIAGGAR